VGAAVDAAVQPQRQQLQRRSGARRPSLGFDVAAAGSNLIAAHLEVARPAPIADKQRPPCDEPPEWTPFYNASLPPALEFSTSYGGHYTTWAPIRDDVVSQESFYKSPFAMVDAKKAICTAFDAVWRARSSRCSHRMTVAAERIFNRVKLVTTGLSLTPPRIERLIMSAANMKVSVVCWLATLCTIS
jgi:hypothetical protein